ncbi:MAG: ABC transporter ATP-binding protein [Lachnospiraceae bacterium]|nr:ABC transporter ATP-binding protein [Lachnospiraceae bacterium]
MKELLTIQDLNVWYIPEKKVLKNFSLSLRDHEVVGLIGLNGAGKTTLLKVISGLLTSYDAKKLEYDGKALKPRDASFQFARYTVFAEDDSFRYFTFREYLSYACKAYKKTIPDVSEMIEGFNFGEFADKMLKDLSTGNRKKAYLITAFALRLPLLFLDEPVNGLDFTSTEYLYKLIAGYKEYGTVLFSSHILESITLTSDRVFVLENGAIQKTFEGDQIQPDTIREALNHDNSESV